MSTIECLIGAQAAYILNQPKTRQGVLEILESDDDDREIWERLRAFFSSTSADNILCHREDILIHLSHQGE